ncbi:hypothetical protein M8J77_025094 [Diaphorina citri]|nr:hypothetical protein M8J77_025094 [Diaphorina citri]
MSILEAPTMPTIKSEPDWESNNTCKKLKKSTEHIEKSTQNIAMSTENQPIVRAIKREPLDIPWDDGVVKKENEELLHQETKEVASDVVVKEEIEELIDQKAEEGGEKQYEVLEEPIVFQKETEVEESFNDVEEEQDHDVKANGKTRHSYNTRKKKLNTTGRTQKNNDIYVYVRPTKRKIKDNITDGGEKNTTHGTKRSKHSMPNEKSTLHTLLNNKNKGLLKIEMYYKDNRKEQRQPQTK